MGSGGAIFGEQGESSPGYWKQNLTATRTRRRDLFELIVAYGLILLVIWTPRPWNGMLWIVTAATILTLATMSFEGLEQMGLCRGNFLCPLWAIGISAGVAASAVALAVRFHTLHLPETPLLFARHYGEYALWAWAQQALLQCFCLSRLLRLVPTASVAATIGAVMFAVVHLPSPLLTLITLVCGLAACLVFLRYRNLYTVAVAHAILGTAIAVSIPAPVIRNMRVGRSYLTYTAPPPARLAHVAASATPHAMASTRSLQP